MPSVAQRAAEPAILHALRARYPALFVCFPGTEMIYGGCLAAGRGLCHISPSGSLEPCPFSPESDTNIRDLPLASALRSPLFRAIQAHSGELREVRGSCVLWENRELVDSLARRQEP